MRMGQHIRFLLSIGLASFLVSCGDDSTEADRQGIGAECSSNDQCMEDQSCLTTFAGGYCGKRDCAGDVDCPDGSKCVTHDDGVNYCFRRCTEKPECNENRHPENESNCSSSVTFVEPEANIKACIPPSSGT